MEQLQQEAQIFCNRHEADILPCDPSQTHCLFHVEDDPCELWNVADREPDQVNRLLNLISEFNQTAITPMSRHRHPEGFPRNWGNVFTTWEDDLQEMKMSKTSSSSDEVPFNPVLLMAFVVILYLLK